MNLTNLLIEEWLRKGKSAERGIAVPRRKQASKK